MLASPVSPSISLRSSSSNGSSKANNTYSSPRHPAYLPPSSSNTQTQAQSSPSSHSITSSSVASSNNTTSKYTTLSQIDRVNDVLVDKVLHRPRALYPHSPDNGSALKRLIAFLDGEEEQVDERTRREQQQQQRRHVQSQSGQEQLYAPLNNAPLSSGDLQNRHHAQQESDISHYPSSQSPSLHPSTPPQSSRTRSNQQQQQLHVVNDERERTHTPRASSRNDNYSGELSRFHISNGRAGYQAPPFPVHPQQPRQYHEDHQRSHPADIQSRAHSSAPIQPQPHPSSHRHGEDGHARHVDPTTAPSQSILLSTQAQLDRLKSEVWHLDELVNRLKGQHIAHPSAYHEAGPSSTFAKHTNATQPNQMNEAAYDTAQERDAQDRQQEEEAQRLAQEAEYRRRKLMEYESTPASQSDILSLVRTLDSLVWMRRPSVSSASTLPGTGRAGEKGEDPPSQQDPHAVGRKYGKGDRSDNVIFTKGNLDHLARRVKAWEHIVRSKEEEGRYSFVP